MKSYEFEVSGMNCGHCQTRVETALKPLARSVRVNLDTGIAVVESDKPHGELLSALEKAGYPGRLHRN